MKHIEVVGAIIVRADEKILCLQRATHKYQYLSYKFEFPGGKIETDESKEDALKRELREELKLDIDIESDFLTVEHTYPDFQITLHTFICRALQKDFTLTEHIACQWLSPAELETLDWAEADLPIVAELKENNFVNSL
jgi:8-oxo-dGTP diphosphatase